MDQEPKVSVTLSARAKIAGRQRIPGETVELGRVEFTQLRDAGALALPLPTFDDLAGKGVFSAADFEKAVAAAALQRAGAAFDGELGRLEEEVKRIVATAETEKAELEAQVRKLQARVAELETAISAMTPGVTETGAVMDTTGAAPPEGEVPVGQDGNTEAAKTTPKKAGSGTRKG